MNVVLSPRSEQLVRQQLASGRYHDASEVLEEALFALDERERLEALQAAITIGEEQIERGAYVLYTPELREDIKREAGRMAREGRQPNPDVCP